MSLESWLGSIVSPSEGSPRSLRGLPASNLRVPMPPVAPPRPRAADACAAQPEHALQPTRPIRRAGAADTDPDDLAAIEESLEQQRVRFAAARPSEVHQRSLDVVAALAVYEAAALARDRTVGEIESARRALITSIERLGNDLATYERCFDQLWDERRRLEEALGRLVPQGHMHEVVIPRLQREEPRT